MRTECAPSKRNETFTGHLGHQTPQRAYQQNLKNHSIVILMAHNEEWAHKGLKGITKTRRKADKQDKEAMSVWFEKLDINMTNWT